jgi:cytochrome c-type biogenesis protein CcmH/NrfG
LLSEIYSQLAVAYFGLKDNNKAMAQFKQAQQLNEGNLTLELRYIQALIKNQIEPEKTQERLAQLLQKSAEPLCTHLYAFSFFQQGQYAKALEWQLKITDQKFIQSPIYQEQLGDIYFKLGQMQDALLFWKKAQELGEGSPVLHEKITQKNYVQAP